MFLYICIGVIVILVILKVCGTGQMPAPPENISDDDIRDLALQGQKIQAIKWYRGLHGVGLKEAKEAVEEMIKGES